MPKTFTLTVARVGEGEHQEAEFTVEATGLRLDADGRLHVEIAGGGAQSLGETSWGAFKVVRVASAAARL